MFNQLLLTLQLQDMLKSGILVIGFCIGAVLGSFLFRFLYIKLFGNPGGKNYE